jgi:hypothetical protein
VHELIANLLRGGMKAGLVREADPSRLAEIIHGLVSTEVHRNLYRGEGDVGWIDDLWEFCLGGIARPARRRR